jgi:transposase
MVWDLTKADYTFTPTISKISQQKGYWEKACSRNTLTMTHSEERSDRIYEYGCTELFNQIVSESMNNVSYGAHVLHTDTTNFSVHGDYENPDVNTIEITYGHPKDHRWDLKRFVLSNGLQSARDTTFCQNSFRKCV